MAAQGRPAYTWIEALQRLEAGNVRFVSGRARFPTVQKEVLAELAKGQEPFATILGCSDSRVPPRARLRCGLRRTFCRPGRGECPGTFHPGHAAIRGDTPSHP